MSMGTLGVRIRYENDKGVDDSFHVQALLPIEENKDSWQKVGLVYLVEDDNGAESWEFESTNGRTTTGKDKRIATCIGLIAMGYARRYGDVIDDTPKEDQNGGKRHNAR